MVSATNNRNIADLFAGVKYIIPLFFWHDTPQDRRFWGQVNDLFTVEPLLPQRIESLEREKAELASRSREIEAEIARLRGEEQAK